MSEKSIYISYYNVTSENWIPLYSQVDILNNTVTAPVSHFTAFAIMGTAIPPAPPSAEFIITSFNLNSARVNLGEPVTASAEITNTGGSEGSYTLNLTVNGKTEQMKTVFLAPQATETVAFIITKEEPGSYSVSINGWTEVFTLLAPPPSWLSRYWWTIVTGIVIVVLLLVVLSRKRARPTAAE